jgi:hypothetical protein
MSRGHLSCVALMVVSALGSPPAHAAEVPAENAIYAEGFGPGLLYSFGYDRLIDGVTPVRIGVSYLSLANGHDPPGPVPRMFLFPLSVAYLPAVSGRNALEVGASLTAVWRTHPEAPDPGLELVGAMFAGYRRLPPPGDLQVRVGLCVLAGGGLGFNFDEEDHSRHFGVLPLPYASLGVAF